MKMKLSFVLLALTQAITSSVLANRFNVKEDPKSIEYFIHFSDQILVGEIKNISSTNVTINVVKIFKGSPIEELRLAIKPKTTKTLHAFDESNSFLFFIGLNLDSQVTSLFDGENGLLPLLEIKNRTYAAFRSEISMPEGCDTSSIPCPTPFDEYNQCFPFRVLYSYIPFYLGQIRENEEKEKLEEMQRERDRQINRIPDHVWGSVSEIPDYSGVICTTNLSATK
jgi:hypothetical protein